MSISVESDFNETPEIGTAFLTQHEFNQKRLQQFLNLYYSEVVEAVKNSLQRFQRRGPNALEEMLSAVHYSQDDFVRFVSESITASIAASVFEDFIREREHNREGSLNLIPSEIQQLANDAVLYMSLHPSADRGEISKLADKMLGCESYLYASLKKTMEGILWINKERRHIIRNLLAKGKMKPLRRAKDLRGEMITDPAKAKELLVRHQKLNRALPIASAILDWEAGNPESLRQMRVIIKNLGAFLMDYTEEMERDRILSANWVIAEAKGRPLKVRNVDTDAPAANMQSHIMYEYEEERTAGDVQIHVPDKDGKVKRYFELPDLERGDEYHAGERVAALIKDNPSIAGCVSDLCAEDDVASQGFASEARATGFEYVRKHHEYVRYLIAEIFSIRGLKLPDRTIVLDTAIENTASMYAHLLSDRNQATPGWVLRERNVQVVIFDPKTSTNENGVEAELITDWNAMIHSLY